MSTRSKTRPSGWTRSTDFGPRWPESWAVWLWSRARSSVRSLSPTIGRVLEEAQRQNNAIQKQNQDLLELQRRGQITERFTRAIRVCPTPSGTRSGGRSRHPASRARLLHLGQVSLAEAEVAWRHLEQLVVNQEVERLLEAQRAGGCQAHRDV